MHLSKEEVRMLILQKELFTQYGDLDGQLTANGFDVRLAALVEVNGGGKLGIQKEANKPPQLGKAFVWKGYEDRVQGYGVGKVEIAQSVLLRPLQPYLAVTCEKVMTPLHVMFHITPRSSLFRLTQSLLGCSFGEAGYHGFLTFLLLSFLASEIELGARFAQLSFSELKGTANYTEQKEANYQGGKLF